MDTSSGVISFFEAKKIYERNLQRLKGFQVDNPEEIMILSACGILEHGSTLDEICSLTELSLEDVGELVVDCSRNDHVFVFIYDEEDNTKNRFAVSKEISEICNCRTYH